MDLQSEYNQAPADPGQQQQPAAQDVTLPGAAVAQIAQAIQQQDCATVMKIIAGVLSGGGGGDTDQDGM